MSKFNMNVFQIAVVACALFVGWTSAQGHMYSPIPIQGDNDITGYSNNLDGCGLSTAQQYMYTNAQRAPSMSIYAGQVVTLGYIANGPLGFGPMYVRFDSNGMGSNYTSYAQITNNLAGTNGYLQQSPSGSYPYRTSLTFTVPQNLQCNNNGLCLMQVLNQQAYVSCTYVKLVSQTTNSGDLTQVNAAGTGLYGGVRLQAQLQRLDAIVNILKNLNVDARVLYQSNFNVTDLINRLTSVIN